MTGGRAISAYPLNISSPGKAFLIGEYAVLEGATAVVMAVSRRVKLYRTAGKMRPLVARARRAAAEYLGRLDLISHSWEADSSALYHGRQKLGLGSSAAVAAAAVASTFYEVGEAIELPEVRRRVFEVSNRVHEEFRGGRGSGADVAASVFGGIIAFRREATGQIHLSSWEMPPEIRLVGVWSGQEASTCQMVRAVRRLRDSSHGRYRRLVEQMGLVADRFARDGSRDANALFAAMQEYLDLMRRLGRLAGVPIVTPFASLVAQAAHDCGGAAKPSGAGGGDIVVAAMPRNADIEAFRAALGPGGHWFLDLGVDPEGVRTEGPSQPNMEE